MMDSIPNSGFAVRADADAAPAQTRRSRAVCPTVARLGRSRRASDDRPIPVGDDRDDILRWARDRARAGHGVALATVVETWGSAPRRAGSQMAVDADGDFVGSVSGGCVEAAILTEAADVIADGGTRMLDFGVSAARAWTVGLACGGRIRILVEPLVVPDAAEDDALDIIDRLLDARARRAAVVHATALDGGSHRLIFPGQSDPLSDPAGAALAAGRACVAETDDGPLLLNPFEPTLRLIVVGAVHIAEPLVRIAVVLGHAVTVIDPREVFLRPDRFDGADLIDAWPEEAFATLGLDARTAVVVLTHVPEIDDRALTAALASPAYYVGALGSRRSHAGRLERLAAAGLGPQALARIDGPIGLDIGAEGPSEIAVAIVAGIVASLHGRRP